MQLRLADVPVDVRHRVVALLENLRNSPADPTGGTFALTDVVTPLVGEDGEVAYFEFPLDLGRRLHGPWVGFVIASAHHPGQLLWSFDGAPPSTTFAGSGTRHGGPRRSKVRDTLRDTTACRVVA